MNPYLYLFREKKNHKVLPQPQYRAKAREKKTGLNCVCSFYSFYHLPYAVYLKTSTDRRDFSFHDSPLRFEEVPIHYDRK